MSNVPQALNRALIRKPACHAGWDWGLAQMTTGFCGPVRLVAHDGPKIDYVYSSQAFNADFSRCDLTIFADVTEADGAAHTVTNRVCVESPPLWWPNGAGEQRFYEYEIDEDGVVGRKSPRAPAPPHRPAQGGGPQHARHGREGTAGRADGREGQRARTVHEGRELDTLRRLRVAADR